MSRLQKYLLNEAIIWNDIDINKWIGILEDECQPYLKECRKVDDFLYRGSPKSNSEGIFKLKPRMDRRPMDTPRELHNYLDKLFKKKFGWEVRSEGVFVTGDDYQADNYGIVYLFFPIGQFKYVWSPKISDMLHYLDGKNFVEQTFGWELTADIENSKILQDMVNTYTDKGLSKAIANEGEISVKCKEYYLFEGNKYERDFGRELL